MASFVVQKSMGSLSNDTRLTSAIKTSNSMYANETFTCYLLICFPDTEINYRIVGTNLRDDLLFSQDGAEEAKDIRKKEASSKLCGEQQGVQQ